MEEKKRENFYPIITAATATDERDSLQIAKERGLEYAFSIQTKMGDEHPNTADMDLTGRFDRICLSSEKGVSTFG